MKEVYLEIDGKRTKLTEEQLKALGLETEMKNPLERVEYGKEYYFVDTCGNVRCSIDVKNQTDNDRCAIANYCTDMEIMQQRVYMETLNRLLWRYSMEHGGMEFNWNDKTQQKWRIAYSHTNLAWTVVSMATIYVIGAPYFTTKEIAFDAIREIIKPFMAEHPEVNAQGKARRKHAKPVFCIDTGTVYTSVADAAIGLNSNSGDVSNCCNGKIKRVKGHRLCFVSDVPSHLNEISGTIKAKANELDKYSDVIAEQEYMKRRKERLDALKEKCASKRNEYNKERAKAYKAQDKANRALSEITRLESEIKQLALS